MSRRSEGKKARRRKRQAAQVSGWLPENVLDEIVSTQAAIATDLEAFDQRITERGWEFDEEESDEDFVFWYYEPSGAEVTGDDLAPLTTVWMSADEDAEVVHLMLVGTADNSELTPDEFFECIDVIETYRFGNPPPDFN